MCFAQEKAKRERYGHWMFVRSGIKFYPLDPRPEEIDIADIAAGLSKACRFAGQITIPFYSVAEHSVHVARVVEKTHPDQALEALLHDGAEGYLQDMIRPMKRAPEFEEPFLRAEKRMEIAIAERFNLVYPWSSAIKAADEAVVAAEVRQIINGPVDARVGYLHDDNSVADIMVRGLSPYGAEILFMQEFDRLWKARHPQLAGFARVA